MPHDWADIIESLTPALGFASGIIITCIGVFAPNLDSQVRIYVISTGNALEFGSAGMYQGRKKK